MWKGRSGQDLQKVTNTKWRYRSCFSFFWIIRPVEIWYNACSYSYIKHKYVFRLFWELAYARTRLLASDPARIINILTWGLSPDFFSRTKNIARRPLIRHPTICVSPAGGGCLCDIGKISSVKVETLHNILVSGWPAYLRWLGSYWLK